MIHVDNLYLVSSTLWSLIGLVVGYGLGCYHQRLKEGHAPMEPSDTPTAPETTPTAPAAPPPWHSRSSLLRTFAGVLILLLVVGTMAEMYRTTACQTDYNAAVARAIGARAEESDTQLAKAIEQLDAQLALLAPQGGGPSDPAARAAEGLRRVTVYRDAVVANRDALVRLRDSRAANPVPDAEQCGRVGLGGASHG